jgi:hypothetical protein
MHLGYAHRRTAAACSPQSVAKALKKMSIGLRSRPPELGLRIHKRRFSMLRHPPAGQVSGSPREMAFVEFAVNTRFTQWSEPGGLCRIFCPAAGRGCRAATCGDAASAPRTKQSRLHLF